MSNSVWFQLLHSVLSKDKVPGSILSAAVDVSSVLHQVAYDPQPAAGAGLVQGAVPGVVSVVNVTDASLQTVQHHLLHTSTTNKTRDSLLSFDNMSFHGS